VCDPRTPGEFALAHPNALSQPPYQGRRGKRPERRVVERESARVDLVT
jgi:hypothetical protein